MEKTLFYDEISLEQKSAYYDKYNQVMPCGFEGCKLPALAIWFRPEEGEDDYTDLVCIGASCDNNAHVPAYDSEMVG